MSDVNYYSFSEKRADEAWEAEGRAQALEFLARHPQIEEEERMLELTTMDLEAGSVANDPFEEPKLESVIAEAIIKDFQLLLEEEVPTRAGWLLFLDRVKERRMAGVTKYLIEEYDFEEEQANEVLRDFLLEAGPVLKDLRIREDAIFCRVVDGEIEPTRLARLLEARTKRHLEELR